MLSFSRYHAAAEPAIGHCDSKESLVKDQAASKSVFFSHSYS
jgi:hypothetical protein